MCIAFIISATALCGTYLQDGDSSSLRKDIRHIATFGRRITHEIDQAVISRVASHGLDALVEAASYVRAIETPGHWRTLKSDEAKATAFVHARNLGFLLVELQREYEGVLFLAAKSSQPLMRVSAAQASIWVSPRDRKVLALLVKDPDPKVRSLARSLNGSQ